MTGAKPNESLEQCGTDAGKSEEIVSFHRRSELPGVEVRSLKNSARAFRCYSTDFEFFAPSTWHGEIWHRRQHARMDPGALLCSHPGEVFLARRVITPGAGSFLTIDARVLHEYLVDHQQSAAKLQLSAVTRMSRLLTEKLLNVFQVVRPGPSALEIQTAMVEFVNVMVVELLEQSSGGPACIESGLRVAERVRECLQYDSSATVDLSTLAKQAGVSRYQALRMFKRRYGLPPHTYQLNVRLALAQKALREGHQPVQVAAQYGFVDQSHFTRHFKRLLGVTPAQYARVGARSRALRVKPFPESLLSDITSERASSRATGYGNFARSPEHRSAVGPSSADL
ncbi:MAG TPA: helix-turn-helix transcriptional regulator [Polyangiaceae bacterium]|nr:helix-turn-helix transcriptional regulator [Polyangiaceae bacterium]